jgi:hypothetical protein
MEFAMKTLKLPKPPAAPFILARCEIAPGKHAVVKLPAAMLQTFGMVKLEKRPDGSFYPLLQTWEQEVRLTDDLPEKLGLDIDASTLRVLVYAGLIPGSRVTPFVTWINMQGLLDHIEATRGDLAAEFWRVKGGDYSKAYYMSGMRVARRQAAVEGQRDLFEKLENEEIGK